jgi:hypothetical protein
MITFPKRFKDKALQQNYEYARLNGVPRFGSTIYVAYRYGMLHPDRPTTQLRGSMGYVWWRAGIDNRKAMKLGARDRDTFARNRIELPEGMTEYEPG